MKTRLSKFCPESESTTTKAHAISPTEYIFSYNFVVRWFTFYELNSSIQVR